jgi:hypothetical protein
MEMTRIVSVLLSMLLALLLIASIGSGQVRSRNQSTLQPAPLILDEPTGESTAPTQGSYIPGLDNATSIAWVAVDSMANAFGPASNVVPLVYDNAIGTLALIHRGVAPYGASGGLYYNVSHDGGATWRRVGEISAGQTQNLRYPTMYLRNPNNGNDTSNVWACYAAPNLRNPASGGSFGSITYGVDLFGANTPVSDFDDGPNGSYPYSTSISVWSETAGDNPNIMWAVRNTLGATAGGEYYLWRTNDYISVNRSVPPTWANANFTNPFSTIGAEYRNGKSYFHTIGWWPPTATDTGFVFNYGYSRSTNGGVTWSGWTYPPGDWAASSGAGYDYDLVNFYRGTANVASFQVQALIDANDRGHYFSVVCDSPWTITSRRSLLEVYQTPSGWSHKFITRDINQYTALMYPSAVPGQGPLDQTYHALHPSISPDGQVMSLVWLDAASPTSADTMPDIWFSWRRIDGASWATPVNLTQTPGFMEILLHAAPVLRPNGGNSYTLFLGRSYQAGVNTYPPESTVKTIFYVGSYTFNATTVGVDDIPTQPVTFSLDQNYPNPFNPETRIQYRLSQQTHVRLTVYNSLGQVVATLVNGVQASGEQEVLFNASTLSSGVYFYELRAGSSVDRKKMVLAK